MEDFESIVIYRRHKLAIIKFEEIEGKSKRSYIALLPDGSIRIDDNVIEKDKYKESGLSDIHIWVIKGLMGIPK